MLANAIAEGRRIVTLVGFGAIRSGAATEIKRLIERFQIPLLTTLDGKGIVSEGHPLAVGVFADSGHASAWKAFREADVVLCVGNSLNQHATFNYREDLFNDKLLIHVNIAEAEFHKAYKPDYGFCRTHARRWPPSRGAGEEGRGRCRPPRSRARTTKPGHHPAAPGRSTRESSRR